jgi:RHS repeat-associated protein
LDEQFKFVESSSGTEQVGDDQEFKTFTKTNLPVTKNGYLYVYVSNETPDIDVFFDNLQVTHIHGPLVEETHYYPFGLTMAGISDKAANGLINRKKYNGIEFDQDLDLNSYEAFYRNLDPQTGRWWQIDSKPDFMWSPYTGMANNPILFSDLLGDTVKLGNLYDKDNNGHYKNVTEILAFELFASTKGGKQYILSHAEKGFSLKGALVEGLNIKAKKEGKASANGVDIGLNVVDHIADGVAKTEDITQAGRLKISFKIEKSNLGMTSNNNQDWRDNLLNKVDSWSHEFFLHGDLLEQKFLNGSQVNPYSHSNESLSASKYYNSGLQVLQGVQNFLLNLNSSLKPHSAGYLYDHFMMTGLGHLVPLNSPKY